MCLDEGLLCHPYSGDRGHLHLSRARRRSSHPEQHRWEMAWGLGTPWGTQPPAEPLLPSCGPRVLGK